MSPDEHKAIVLRTLDRVFVRKDPDALLEADAEDVVLHVGGFPAPVVGREAVREWAANQLAAFDTQVTVENAIAEGDCVVLRSTMRLLHKGEYLGVPTTGRRLTFTQMELIRFAGGKIQEAWVSLDTLGVMQQLGVMPAGRPPRALLQLIIGLQRLFRGGSPGAVAPGRAGESGESGESSESGGTHRTHLTHHSPDSPDSPPEGNKALALRFLDEVFGKKNLAALREICASDFVVTIPGYPEPLRGVAAVERWATSYLAAFDSRLTVEEVVAEGDIVALRFVVRGTHRGEYLGIPPTGRRVEFSELSLTRYADGKAQEGWLMLDTLGVMQQLGLFPKGQPPRALLRTIVGLQRLVGRRSGEGATR